MELEVAMVYAEALYGAAKDSGHVNEVREELTQIDDAIRGNDEFREVFMNPGISVADKKEILKNVFEGKVLDETMNFLYILVDKHRMYGFHDMVRQYRTLMDKAEGIGEGIIYSAFPLTEEQHRKFEKETGRLFQKTIHLENRVDKKLLGGVRLFVDGKMIDASAQRKLEELANKIKIY